jgi:hypothetical protein
LFVSRPGRIASERVLNANAVGRVVDLVEPVCQQVVAAFDRMDADGNTYRKKE